MRTAAAQLACGARHSDDGLHGDQGQFKQEAVQGGDANGYDFFFCHTKSSQRQGWSTATFVRDLVRLLRRRGASCFFDVDTLPGQPIRSCTVEASNARVLVCVLDDSFPTTWCQREIEAAISNNVPILTVFDQNEFHWREVGVDAWRLGGHITQHVIRAVFARGAIYFNGHMDYIDRAEELFTQRALAVLDERRAVRQGQQAAAITSTPSAARQDRRHRQFIPLAATPGQTLAPASHRLPETPRREAPTPSRSWSPNRSATACTEDTNTRLWRDVQDSVRVLQATRALLEA